MLHASFRPSRLFITAVAALVVAACAAGGCKARAARSAGFIDEGDMTKDATLPFHKSWMKPGFDKSKFTRLYVAPVNTQYMLRMTNWQEGERKAEIQKDIDNLAIYTQASIKSAFANDPRHRMIVLDAPGNSPDTLILEVALIEVIPSKVVLNALGFTPFYIGTAINAVRGLADDTSSVAFEARIRDASTGETVAKFADREQQQMSAVSVRGLTWYGHAETIIDQWSRQFVQIANRKPGEVVKDTDPFTLKPW